jgi:hypothetical protein
LAEIPIIVKDQYFEAATAALSDAKINGTHVEF